MARWALRIDAEHDDLSGRRIICVQLMGDSHWLRRHRLSLAYPMDEKKQILRGEKNVPLRGHFVARKKAFKLYGVGQEEGGRGGVDFGAFGWFHHFFGGIAFNCRRQMYKNRHQNVHKIVPNVHKIVPNVYTRRSLLCRRSLDVH